MKLERPRKIAICLNASDLDRALEQKQALISIEDTFDVEWDFRAKRFSGPYVSFSQMINESVIITESEFMIFINPKSEVKPDDVYNIIDDLCDGYALSTVIAFGFWGCTKQLFNKVGLMDERFIGGEYEDDDFIIRLIENDLAICWNFVEDNYDNSSPQIQTHTRGISANIFREKWNIDKQSKTIKRSINYLVEKGIKVFLEDDVTKSWKSFKDSKIKTNHGILNNYLGYSFINQPSQVKYISTHLKIIIKKVKDKHNISVLSTNPINITIAITRVIGTARTRLLRFTFNQNTGYTLPIQLDKSNFGIIIWHRDHIIYANDTIFTNDDLYFENSWTINDNPIFLD